MPNFVQQEILNRLLGKLEFIQLNPEHILDLSSPAPSTALADLYPNAEIHTDFPLEPKSIDLVFANLMPLSEEMLQSIHTYLKPEGFLLLSALGPDSFIQLQQAAKLNQAPFIDLHDIGDALQKTEFTDVVMDAERLTLHYKDFAKLWEESAPWHTDLHLRDTDEQPFETHYPKTDQGYIVSLEITYAHALGASPAARLKDGVVTIDPTSITHRKKF